MDAGTDNGFTFTSPNWPTSPQGSIFRITNVYPDHPAGSFNYPEKPSLPTIAKFTFTKVCPQFDQRDSYTKLLRRS